MPEAKLTVWLTPKAPEDRVDGWRDGMLTVRVSAPPIEGQANEALLRLLAHELMLPIRSLRLVSGQRSRRKLIAVDGLTSEELQQRLAR
jgi:uncharacterized protein (TIGR00251 family)